MHLDVSLGDKKSQFLFFFQVKIVGGSDSRGENDSTFIQNVISDFEKAELQVAPFRMRSEDP